MPSKREHVRALAGPSGCGTGRRPARRSVPYRKRSCCSSRQAPATACRGRSRSARRSPGSPTRRSSELPTDHGTSAPSAIESDGSGTSRSGSISCCAPRPVQRGHAPCGELNEKIRGWSSGSETPCSGQAKLLGERAARSPSTTSIATRPSASAIAVSIDCASRSAQVRLHHEPVDDDLDRVLELLVERRISSSSRCCSPSTFTRVKPSCAQLLEDVPVLALAVAHDRRVDREPRPLRERAGSGRRSRRSTGPRSAGRRPGSAAARRARRAGAGSRRSR